MTGLSLVFYGFAVLTILSAFMVVLSHNPVRAALSLVLTFFSMAVLWMLLESEFLAIALVLVYVGAVMVLFLFVVMMLDIEQPMQTKLPVPVVPVAWLIALMLIILLGWTFTRQGISLPDWTVRTDEYRSVEVLGTVLFSDYLLAFELAGIILLVAIVAAISLTFRGKRPGNRTISPAEQSRVKKSDRLKIIQMPTEIN